MIKFPPISTDVLQRVTHGTFVCGTGAHHVTELGEPLEVGPGGVAFIISEAYLKHLPLTQACALVVQSKMIEKIIGQLPETVKVCISCPDAYLGLARFSQIVRDAIPECDWLPLDGAGTAIHPTAQIHPTVRLGPGAIVSERVSIGEASVLLGNVTIGPKVRIGSRCVIFPGVVLYPGTVVGNRVRIHANAVLGSDGFGYARGPRGAVKIWHFGNVVVGDDVEIGAGATIDRGTLKDTIIDEGAKLDNLVHIGHNGYVKSHAILCAQVGLSGNVTVGSGAILAGKVGVADKIEIGDGAIIGPASGVSKDVKPGEILMGKHRAKPRREWWKLVRLFERLPELFERVKNLEQSRDGEVSASHP